MLDATPAKPSSTGPGGDDGCSEHVKPESDGSRAMSRNILPECVPETCSRDVLRERDQRCGIKLPGQHDSSHWPTSRWKPCEGNRAMETVSGRLSQRLACRWSRNCPNRRLRTSPGNRCQSRTQSPVPDLRSILSGLGQQANIFLPVRKRFSPLGPSSTPFPTGILPERPGGRLFRSVPANSGSQFSPMPCA